MWERLQRGGCSARVGAGTNSLCNETLGYSTPLGLSNNGVGLVL